MPSRPNVLLITTDEQRFDAAGFNGNRHIKTPNLDALAEDSVVLSNHTCSSPICTPARASILTGLYPYSHGAWHVGYKLDESIGGLAHWLGDAGYHCGFSGKAHFEAEESGYVNTLQERKEYYGFTETHITEDVPDGEYVDWIREAYPGLGDTYLKACHEDVQKPPIPMAGTGRIDAVYTSPVPEAAHQTAWITDRAIDMTEQAASDDTPFFVWCSYVDPHHPWNPPEPFASMYDPASLPGPAMREGETDGLEASYFFAAGIDDAEYRRMRAAYYGLVSHIDHHCGRLLDRLKTLGIYDDTLIIFTSDHGDFDGDHGLIRKNAWLYESILKVPCTIKPPGKPDSPASPSSRIEFDGLSQHEDLAPTILEYAGVDPGKSMLDGISLVPVIGRSTTTTTGREYAFFEYMGIQGVRKGPFKLLHYPRREWNQMLRRGSVQSDGPIGSLLRYPDDSDGFLLTNVDDDPLEYENLAGRAETAEIERELKDVLLERLLKSPRYFPPKPYRW